MDSHGYMPDPPYWAPVLATPGSVPHAVIATGGLGPLLCMVPANTAYSESLGPPEMIIVCVVDPRMAGAGALWGAVWPAQAPYVVQVPDWLERMCHYTGHLLQPVWDLWYVRRVWAPCAALVLDWQSRCSLQCASQTDWGV